MRIQHNIPAMSAYRNYTANVSAVQKNLEKLSSGYRINRAGDDAAGLAISEKMRAQISGLEQAQSNAKSGINLVQTGEGALTEVHDMLNRMYTLAEQSANGTYDDSVDRLQLQKEVDSLRKEINRIADSTNFNGIKLLDGSLDDGAKAAVEAATGNFEIPGTGALQDDLGTKTITHTSSVEAGMITFGVELGDLEFSNQTGESLVLSIGDSKITFAAGSVKEAANGTTAITAGKTVKAADIAKTLAEAANGTGLTLDGISITAKGKWTIGDVTFDVALNSSGTGLTFTQNAEGEFDGDMAVSAEGKDLAKAGWKTGAYTAGKDDATGTTMKNDGKIDIKVTAPDSTGKGGNETLKFGLTGLDNKATTAELVTALQSATATNANNETVTLGDLYDIAANADNTISFTLKDGKDATMTSFVYTPDTGTADANNTAGSFAAAGAAIKGGFASGTYNTQTTETSPSAGDVKKNLASTVITLDAAKMSNGSKVIFGENKYEFTTDEAEKPTTDGTAAKSEGKVYVGDLDLNTEAGMKAAIDRLSVAAKDNAVWAVGYAGEGGKVTVTEKADATGTGWMDQADANKKKFDLTTVEGIKKSLGYETAAQDAVEGDPTKGLTLQIGDTAEDFNKLTVSVKDMHADAMGIGDIDISSQTGASDAMAKIKDAINYVSDARGTLGALQNRLDHTINNLSVAQENIQDAESTIRDVDIAKEMMAYTKNNILVQSAQAMLAQANQLPQGVLQLLG